MATKKQKRAAAEAKREKFMADLRAEGLAAQKASREAEKKRRERDSAEAQKINERYRNVLVANGIIPDAKTD